MCAPAASMCVHLLHLYVCTCCFCMCAPVQTHMCALAASKSVHQCKPMCVHLLHLYVCTCCIRAHQMDVDTCWWWVHQVDITTMASHAPRIPKQGSAVRVSCPAHDLAYICAHTRAHFQRACAHTPDFAYICAHTGAHF